MPFKNDRAPSRKGADHPEQSGGVSDECIEGAGVSALAPPIRTTPLRLIHGNPEIANRAAVQPVETPQTDPQHTEMTSERHAAMLDRALQARIGAMLREVFYDVANAPVPDRFTGLLQALAAKDKSRA
jgi:hypothetical protein